MAKYKQKEKKPRCEKQGWKAGTGLELPLRQRICDAGRVKMDGGEEKFRR